MSEDEFDAFGDITNRETGIFGSALTATDEVRSQTGPMGLTFSYMCPGCGAAAEITAEWPEIVAMRVGVNPGYAMQGLVQHPTNWFFVDREASWRVDLRCTVGSCTAGQCLRVKPHEWDGAIGDGIRRRFLNAAAAQQLQQRAQQALQEQMQGRR